MWTILRRLQTVINTSTDYDIKYNYYGNTKIGTTSSGLPIAKAISGTGHCNRHVISNDNLNWRNHRLGIITQKWDETLTYTQDWTFENITHCRFILNVLPEADGIIDRFDAEHLLGIFPDLSIS